jgi:hypothetical protein
MIRYIPSFVFCYKFYLVIKKIKAKFVIGERGDSRTYVSSVSPASTTKSGSNQNKKQTKENRRKKKNQM